MRVLFLTFSITACSVLFPVHGLADSVDMMLEKMNQAIRSTNYSGTYVYINQGQIETMQIVHSVDENGERERLLSLNGEAREILRDENQVTCILPADKSVVVGKHKSGTGLPTLVPENIRQLREVYDIELLGKDRVAGYSTLIMVIKPKDKMRYGYRVWLEEDTGMLLRSDIMDDNGVVKEQMMFTEISMQSPVTQAMLAPTVPHSDFKMVTSPDHGGSEIVDAGKASSAWTFNDMPRGFKVTSQSRKRMPMNKHEVQHFVLSDGLATISVYIEKANDEEMFEGASSMGGVNAYGRHVANHQVTVMGEVPGETVKQIAYAVAYSE